MREKVDQLIAAISDILTIGAQYHDSSAAQVAEATIEHVLNQVAAEARLESAERLRKSPSNPRYRGKPWVEAQELIADDIERGCEE